MFTTLKEYASHAQGKLSDNYSGYMAKDDLEKVLIEATANENWNISNSKLLQIADATYNIANVERVSTFLYAKLEAVGPQWRRILKALTAIDFIIKNGSPPAVIQFKRDVYKISAVCNFSYQDQGIDRGSAIRDRVNTIVDILSQESRLYQERAEAFEYRKKFYPGAGPTSEQAGISNPEQAFSCVFSGGYGGGSGSMGAPPNQFTPPEAPPQSMGSHSMGMGGQSIGSQSMGSQPGSNTYNQGFGSNSMGAGQQSNFGGASLGSSTQKVYSPYGGIDGNSQATSMGSNGMQNQGGFQGQGGFSGQGQGGFPQQSMGSTQSSTQQQESTSIFSKSVNMVSSFKTTVVDGAGAVGQAMGLKNSKRGILNNPNEFINQTGSQYPANYNPPTSISSSQYEQTSSQSYSSQQTTSFQSSSMSSADQGFKSTSGPWGQQAKPAAAPQSYDKPFPQKSAPASATTKKPSAPAKSEVKKQMRQVDTESSDSDYGEEIVPKTRAQKNQRATAEKKEASAATSATPTPPAPQVDLLSLIDTGKSTTAAPAAPAQPSFDFMGGSQPAASTSSTQPVDLFGLGTAPAQASPSPAPAQQANVFDLLSGPSTTTASAPAQPATATPPTTMFSGLNLGGQAAPTQQQPAANSGFNFMSNTAPQQQQPQAAQAAQINFDPFAPKPEPVTQQLKEEQKPAAQVEAPKSLFKTQIKGAEFIDLVNLGTKKTQEKPKDQGVYIQTATNAATFQPMAHLSEQQQQQARLNQMMQAQQQQLPSFKQPGQQQPGAGNSAFGFM